MDGSAVSRRRTDWCRVTGTSRSGRGAFEIEMVGPRIDDEGYEPAIRRAIAYLDGVLT
jgi:hypothetical protein